MINIIIIINIRWCR